jgi:hypothetical protein
MMSSHVNCIFAAPLSPENHGDGRGMPDMTTITSTAPPSAAPSLRVPAMVGVLMGVSACALLAVASAFVFLACLTTPAETETFLAENLEYRILNSGRPSKSCGSDGAERETGDPNCFDHRGFRVVVGDRLSVYSMRHQKPLFIFGLQKGMTFVNEKISTQQLEGEKSSFMGYMTDVAR